MAEIAGQWLKHDAEFLASYVLKNKEHSTELVADTYKKLVLSSMVGFVLALNMRNSLNTLYRNLKKSLIEQCKIIKT